MLSGKPRASNNPQSKPPYNFCAYTISYAASSASAIRAAHHVTGMTSHDTRKPCRLRLPLPLLTC